MPRKARIDAPGALHHVIARGIERRIIFTDNSDCDDFLGRLESIVSETHTSCYAWSLVRNHFHLLLKTGSVPIATVMRRLLTGYAMRFNLRHDRTGQLFQNRYKSILCQEDVYFKELIRYIHLNPLRAGIVDDMKKLASYPYSGHSALMGKNDRGWQSLDYVLSLFDTRESKARRLICYWGTTELGLTMTGVANALKISVPTASIAARRGEQIVIERGYSLMALLNIKM